MLFWLFLAVASAVRFATARTFSVSVLIASAVSFAAFTTFMATHRFATTTDTAEAPDACQPNYCIDNTANHCGIAMEKPSDYIKLEESPETPVQSSDDDQNIG